MNFHFWVNYCMPLICDAGTKHKRNITKTYENFIGHDFSCENVYLFHVLGQVKPISVSVFTQERIREMFENLMQVEHPNIVKFHKYWLDMRESRARVRYKTHLI